MSDLPSGWEWATLQDLAAAESRAMTDGPFGSNLKSSHYVDSGPRVIRLQNIGFGEFIDEKAHITEKHFDTLGDHEARAGDLVVASLGQDLPRSCLVPPAVGPAIVKADCIRVRLHRSVDARYVNYALQRPELRNAVADQIHGVGRPRLGMVGIKELSIPLAPAAEQERIVAAIEEHLSRLDSAQALLVSAVTRLDILESRVVDAVFVSHDHRLPVGELAEVRGGIQKQPKRKPTENTAPFLRVANVGHGRLNLSEIHQIELFEGELERHRLLPGDLLVVEGNGSPDQIGRSAVWHGEIDDCVHQNHLIRVRPGPDLDSEFLGLFWNARSTRAQLTAVASSTSGLHTLSTAKVKRIAVPVLSLDGQRAVVTQLTGQIAAFAHLRTSLRLARARLSTLRRSVLAAAFTGDLAPHDRDDEPASLLLERIRTERTAATSAKRTRRAKVS
jgi:type I restriction enzyme S subunit